MRLVIDANQADRIPPTLPTGFTGLTLSPFLLAEVLLRGPQELTRTRAVLSKHHVNIGMQPDEMLDGVARLQTAEIANATPFPVPNSALDQLSRRLLNPSDHRQAANWAKKVKESHYKLCGNFVTLSGRVRKAIKQRRLKRIDNFTEALEVFAQGPNSFLGSLVNTTVRKGRPPGVVTQDPQTLYEVVLTNPYLRRYFHALLYYVVSIARLWRNQPLNRDPQSTRDDWADVALSLYTGNGDVVVSNDSLVRQAFTAIDPAIRVLPAAGLETI